MATAPGMRIGDADREAVAAGLREHYAHGRLTLDEFTERLDAVFAAKTGGDLARITSDLPQLPSFTAPWPAGPSAPGSMPGPGGRSGRRPLSGLSAVAIGLALLAAAVVVLAVSFGGGSIFGIFIARPIFFVLAALVFGRRLFRRGRRRRRF